jgi:hypothetical protein
MGDLDRRRLAVASPIIGGVMRAAGVARLAIEIKR